MVITRTPFRISFFGGGTDHPSWYERNGGAVISATIDKYSYITCRRISRFYDHNFHIYYSKVERVESIDEIQHPSVRECLRFLNLKEGIEVVNSGDLPARAGLGSSSAFTVGLLHALYALTGKVVSKRQLALDAIHVEQNLIKEKVGSQDQTAVAFGGFNRIDFGGENKITVQPIPLTRSKIDFLEKHFLLVYTGLSRDASQIEEEKLAGMPERFKEFSAISDLVEEGYKILQGEEENLSEFGRLLDESWRIKRTLSPSVSTSGIDKIYDAALSAGAWGGKLLGAGGGGFILFFVPPERQNKVMERLKNLITVPFHFENLGSQIIHYVPPDK